MLNRLAVAAGVDPKLATPHRLRHHLGLRSAMAGLPATALMRAMGRRCPIMKARYSEFADSERRWAFARADITKGLALPSGRLSLPGGLVLPLTASAGDGTITAADGLTATCRDRVSSSGPRLGADSALRSAPRVARRGV